MVTETSPASSEALSRFYTELDKLDMAPLWESLHSLVPRTPATMVQAAHWDYDGIVRPRLMEAGQLITARQAERRVLILENPGLRGTASITRSLYAGLQLILPGEVAPAHRHSQSALRFIVEGSGAYTTVSGERTTMHPGDFVLTPNWTWHDHGNESEGPMVWLDGLDIPLVAFLDAGFAEPGDRESQTAERTQGDSNARFGGNLLPVDWLPSSRNSPILNYPYERSREILHRLQRSSETDDCHGFKLRYANPADGGSPMPTIGAFIQLLPGGFRSAPYRSTDSTVYSVVEGSGETLVGDRIIRWKPRDVFVVPSWHRHEHSCASDSVLFSFSDRPVQQSLGLWREERGSSSH